LYPSSPIMGSPEHTPGKPCTVYSGMKYVQTSYAGGSLQQKSFACDLSFFILPLSGLLHVFVDLHLSVAL